MVCVDELSLFLYTSQGARAGGGYVRWVRESADTCIGLLALVF